MPDDAGRQTDQSLAADPKPPVSSAPVAASVTIVSRVTRHVAGPLPPPEILAGYNAIDPTLVDRIMKLAESTAADRRLFEHKSLDSQIAEQRAQRTETRFGQCFAFGLSNVWLIASVYAIVHGYPVAGGLLGGGTLASLVGTFLYRQHRTVPGESITTARPKRPAV